MNNTYIPLLAIFAISFFGHNMSVAYATGILIIMKLLGLDALFPTIEAHGLSLGIMLLTIAILVPIATGRITLPIILESFKSPLGIIAILAGVFAAFSGGIGIDLLRSSPEIVSSLIIGTMIGVFFFKGITVGPLIAAGMVYMILSLGKLFH